MFVESNLAISLAMVGIPVLLLIVVIAVIALRKRRSSAAQAERLAAWHDAGAELGIRIRSDQSKLGPTARGIVNDHQVAIAPDLKGDGALLTQYGVAFDAPEAPAFRITAREPDTIHPVVDTGNPKFDAVVTVECEDVEELAAFLTPPRRAAILRLIAFWPNAEILNSEAYVRSEGIEDESIRLVDSICHLVAAAETFDRPEHTFTDEELEAEQALAKAHLTEAAVLANLFNSDLSQDQMLARFEAEYLGQDVNWSGEVMRIGSYDALGRVQVVVLIGSADGENPASGRIFATTAVRSDPYLAEGKVLNFAGTLSALDTAQRLFQLAAAESTAEPIVAAVSA